MPTRSSILCVGAVVRHGGDLLLIRRRHPPAEGRWSLPGGRVAEGETLAGAAAREVKEETGLDVSIGVLVGTARLSGEGQRYLVYDFAADLVGGALLAGDDALEARFVPLGSVLRLELTGGLGEWLRRHRIV